MLASVTIPAFAITRFSSHESGSWTLANQSSRGQLINALGPTLSQEFFGTDIGKFIERTKRGPQHGCGGGGWNVNIQLVVIDFGWNIGSCGWKPYLGAGLGVGASVTHTWVGSQDSCFGVTGSYGKLGFAASATGGLGADEGHPHGNISVGGGYGTPSAFLNIGGC